MKVRKIVSTFAGFGLGLVFAANSHAAGISGKVSLEGAPPPSQVLKADADPTCKLMHPEGIPSDQVIVSSDGGLKNVFIYVKQGLEGRTFNTPQDPALLDQKGCQYSPKVFGIQTKQTLEILNSDDTLHNVHALPKNSQAFNLGMPIKGMRLKKIFTKPEVMVKIKCEVHPWMGAWAGVLDHPYFSVSDEEGKFRIKDLPPGDYVIEAWHEKYGTQTQNVTLTDEDREISFKFNAE